MAKNKVVRNNPFKRTDNSKHIVTVSRSNKNISAQVSDPKTKKVVFTSNSNKQGISKAKKSEFVGIEIAKFLQSIKVDSVIFNRNGYLYHGRVKLLAESIRNNKITF